MSEQIKLCSYTVYYFLDSSVLRITYFVGERMEIRYQPSKRKLEK